MLLPGRGSVFGLETGKVVAWEVKSAACAKCDREDPSDYHVCRENHSERSKAMEPASDVSLLVANKNFEGCKVRKDVLIGDEDAATVARVKKIFSHLIKKWSDKNHVLEEFSSKSYTVAKCQSCLTKSQTIKYLKSLFYFFITHHHSKSCIQTFAWWKAI